MSKKEVEEELGHLKASMSPKLLEKLKKMGGAIQQPPLIPPVTPPVKKDLDTKPIEMSEVSKAVSDAALS
jgi:hypothetical protein